MLAHPPQVSASRQQEELQSKLRSVEAALTAARDDARRAEAQVERLRQEVEQQADAVKVGRAVGRG